jgi:uncharacterized membrane protein
MTLTSRVATEPDEPTADAAAPRAGVVVPAPSAWWVLIAGVIGLVASVTLTAEKIKLLTDSSYAPSCNINPVLSCGSVMATPQASLLGFPNSLIGIAAFTAVTVTGVLAVSKVVLPQWYWRTVAAGTLLGAIFVHWLIYQSLYRIGALCPYCMVVWALTLSLLVVVASIALRPEPADPGHPVSRALHQWRWSLAALWFTAVFLLILARFWNYWSTLL